MQLYLKPHCLAFRQMRAPSKYGCLSDRSRQQAMAARAAKVGQHKSQRDCELCV
jgi:hypothetical protein